MRNSKIVDSSLFGKYHDDSFTLQLNDTQSMVFTSEDHGPFYLSADERERRKYDKNTGTQVKKKYVRSELIQILKETGIINPVGSVKQLQQQCVALDLPISYNRDKILEGWIGKPKGSFQILYERGWIDAGNIRQYTEKGRVNDMGVLINETSINYLMQKQTDFVHELTLLQYYAEKLGCTLDRSPKCHPELAGDGIEYIWAMAKIYYRNQPLKRKRTKHGFRALVDDCLSTTHNLTIDRVRKCSRRAREYMLAYKAFEELQTESSGDGGDDSAILSFLNFELVEKSIKSYKTHRNAKDFDSAFVKGLKLEDKKVFFIKEVVSKMKASF
jgi:hypothetical protein